MPTKTARDYIEAYEALLGYVPPSIQHRISLGLECDPGLLDKLEELRNTAMYPGCIDEKTVQMILFAVLLAQLAPAARGHAIAAKRAGATKQELHAVAGLTFLFRGLSAFNIGAEIINEIFADDEPFQPRQS